MKPFLTGLWFYGFICHLLDRGETSYDGRPMHSLKLIISEVSSEDYEQPFVCQASNAFGQVASYIILKHRGKKYYYFWGLWLSILPQKGSLGFDTKFSCFMLKENKCITVCSMHVPLHREEITTALYLLLF